MTRKNKSLFDRSIGALGTMGRLPTTVRGAGPRTPVEAKLARDLVETARTLAEEGLTWGTVGSISARLGTRQMLIAPTGVPLNALEPGDLTPADLHNPRPPGVSTAAWALHGAIYSAQSEAAFILHLQPPHATVIAGWDDVRVPDVPQVLEFWAGVARVDVAEISVQEAAARVADACKARSVVLARSLGVVVWARAAADATAQVRAVESVARMAWLESAGQPRR